jgi:hypothetical protein
VLAESVLFTYCHAAFSVWDITNMAACIFSLPLPSEANPAGINTRDWAGFRLKIEASLRMAVQIFVVKYPANDLHFDGRYDTAWYTFKLAENRLATDPRDKVYSLLALSSTGVEADYSKYPEMIYHDFCQVGVRSSASQRVAQACWKLWKSNVKTSDMDCGLE